MKQQILELIDRKMEKIPSKYNPINIILQELRSEIENMNEWIPVNERLPEELEEVLVYSYGLYILASYEKGQWRETSESRDIEKIQFWQPLSLPHNQ